MKKSFVVYQFSVDINLYTHMTSNKTPDILLLATFGKGIDVLENWLHHAHNSLCSKWNFDNPLSLWMDALEKILFSYFIILQSGDTLSLSLSLSLSLPLTPIDQHDDQKQFCMHRSEVYIKSESICSTMFDDAVCVVMLLFRLQPTLVPYPSLHLGQKEAVITIWLVCCIQHG